MAAWLLASRSRRWLRLLGSGGCIWAGLVCGFSVSPLAFSPFSPRSRPSPRLVVPARYGHSGALNLLLGGGAFSHSGVVGGGGSFAPPSPLLLYFPLLYYSYRPLFTLCLDTDRTCRARWYIRARALRRDRGLVSCAHRTLMVRLSPSLFSRPLPRQFPTLGDMGSSVFRFESEQLFYFQAILMACLVKYYFNFLKSNWFMVVFLVFFDWYYHCTFITRGKTWFFLHFLIVKPFYASAQSQRV
jgi:hypothetical protein